MSRFLSYFTVACRKGALVAAACIAAPAPLALAHSDALLASVGGKVTLGTAEEIDGVGETFALGASVFEAILRGGFSPPPQADYEGDEPGFFALHSVNDAAALATIGASPLPSSAPVTANVTPFTVNGAVDALFYWDGVGAVDFQPISLAQPGVTFGFKPAAFGLTGANGELDDHPIYQINHAAGTPSDGVYLAAPTIGVAGLTTSEPFYMAFLVDSLIQTEDDLETVEAALEQLEEGLTPDAIADFGGGVTKDFAFYEESVEWVESNLVVPEPGALALGLLGLCGLGGVARRTRR